MHINKLIFVLFLTLINNKQNNINSIGSTYILSKFKSIENTINNLFNPDKGNKFLNISNKIYKWITPILRYLGFEIPNFKLYKKYKIIGLNGVIEIINLHIKDLWKIIEKNYIIKFDIDDLKKIINFKNDDIYNNISNYNFQKYLQNFFRIYLYFYFNISEEIYTNKQKNLEQLFLIIRYFKTNLFKTNINTSINYNVLIIEERLLMINESLTNLIFISENLTPENIEEYNKQQQEEFNKKYNTDELAFNDFDTFDETIKSDTYRSKITDLKEEIKQYKKLSFIEISKLLKDSFDEISISLNNFGFLINKNLIIKWEVLDLLGSIKQKLWRLILYKSTNDFEIKFDLEEYLLRIKNLNFEFDLYIN